MPPTISVTIARRELAPLAASTVSKSESENQGEAFRKPRPFQFANQLVNLLGQPPLGPDGGVQILPSSDESIVGAKPRAPRPIAGPAA
jgi:hypothetical protein